MPEEKEKPINESLEDILNRLDKKKDRPRLDYSKFAPIGWQRLTDEQRQELQKMIDRYLETNKSRQ